MTIPAFPLSIIRFFRWWGRDRAKNRFTPSQELLLRQKHITKRNIAILTLQWVFVEPFSG
jgi:hypothetical protein